MTATLTRPAPVQSTTLVALAQPAPVLPRGGEEEEGPALDLPRLRAAWRARPADEYHATLPALIAAAKAHEARLAPRLKPLAGLVFGYDATSVYLVGKADPVYLTHLAFRQLCGILGAPAGHLVPRSPGLVHHYLTEMVSVFAGRKEHNLLSCLEGGHWVVECVTGAAYGRIYNSQLAAEIERVRDGRWVPAAATALARSRHSVDLAFTDPSAPIDAGGEVFYPGFTAYNSIAGDRSIGMTARAHLPVADVRLPVATDVASVSLRHTKLVPERFRKEIVEALHAFATADWTRTRADYAWAQRTHVPGGDEGISKLLKRAGLTQDERKAVWECVGPAADGAVTHFRLGVAIATHARSIGQADERLRVEGLAAHVLREPS